MDITAHDSAGLLGGVLVGRAPALQQFSGGSDLAALPSTEAEQDIILVLTVSALRLLRCACCCLGWCEQACRAHMCSMP